MDNNDIEQIHQDDGMIESRINIFEDPNPVVNNTQGVQEVIPITKTEQKKANVLRNILPIALATVSFLSSCTPIKGNTDVPKGDLTKPNVENTESIPTGLPTNTPTPTELPTATPTLKPTETKEPTPTERPKCTESFTFDPWEVSVEIDGYGEFKTNGEWSPAYIIGLPGTFPGHGPENTLDILRHNPGNFSFEMPMDITIHNVDPNLRILVDGKEWAISSVLSLHDEEQVFVKAGSVVEVYSNGNLRPNTDFMFLAFKPSEEIDLKKSFMVGEQAFPILCDESSGHYYVNAQGTAKSMVITSEYSGYFTNTENIYSFSRNGYFTYGDDLVGYPIDPDNPATVTFKNTENMDFSITFER